MLKNKTKLFLLFSLVLITLVGVSAVSAVAVDNSTTTLEAAPSYTADTQANINTADDNNKNLEQDDVSTITSTQKDTAQEAKAVSTKTVEKTNTKQLKTVDPQNGIDVSFPSTVIAGNDLTVTVTYDQTVEEGDITAVIMKNEEYQSDFTDAPLAWNDETFTGTTGSVSVSIPLNSTDGTYYVYVNLMDDNFDEYKSALYPLEITGGIVPVVNTSVDIDFESPVTAGSDVLVNVTTGESLNGALLNIELYYPDNDPEEFGSMPDQSYWLDHQGYITLTSTFNQYTFTIPEDINGTCHLMATVDAYETEFLDEFKSEIKPLEVIANVEKTTPSLTMDVDEDHYQEDGIVVYGELRDEDYEGISNASITVTVTYTQDGNDTSLKGDEVQTVDTITDEEGQYQVTIPALYTGTINVVADFAGNDNYNPATSETKSTRVIKNEDKPKETVEIIFVEDPFYYDDDVISVNGYLEDVNGDQIDASDITVTVTVTYSDNTQFSNSSVTENGEFDVTIPANAVLGDATIVITTTANDVYDAATETYQTEIIARPDVNITLESSNVTYPDDIVINGQVTSNVDDVITNVAGSNINISVTNKNGESRNYTTTTDSEGKYTYSIPVSEDDIGEVTISVALDDVEYKTKTNTTTVEVTEVIKTTPTIQWELDQEYPVDAVVSINGYVIVEDEGIEDLPVTVTLTYAGEEPIVKEITTTTDGEFEYVFTTEDGKKAGDLTVTVTTGETQEYESTSQTEETVITPAEAKETSLSLDPMDDYYDDTIEVEGTISYIDVDGNEQDLPAGMNVNVVVTFADSTTVEETATVADEGIFTVSIPTEDKYGVAQVVATFVETPEYLGSSDNKDVTVRYPTDLTIFADESTQEEGLTITGYLTYGDSEDFADQTITVTATYTNGDLVDTFDVTTEEDGTFTITRDALATGEVTIVAEYDGTNVYSGSEDIATTTINENEPKETIITPALDDTATDIIDVEAQIDYIDNNDQLPLPDGEVTITVTFADGTQTTTPATINNGEISTTIPTQGKTGQATVNISYPGTEEYKATEAIVTVNILEVPDLFVDANENPLSEGLTVNGYLDDAEGNGIAGQTITITATYDDDFVDTFTATTEDDGTYTTTVPAHKIGEVSIVATFDETTQYAAAEDQTTTTITEDEPKETIITPGIDDTATDIIDIQATIDYIDNQDQIPLPTGEATITITFADGTTTTTPTTINNGEITTTIPTQAKTGQATINISYPGTEEYKPTEAIVTVNILTQTYLSVEADDAAMDEELEIYGSLVTKDDEEGIADATINIKVTYADGQTQDLTVTTDENGDYQTTTTPLAIGNVTIVATFDETEVYSEATATDDAEITPAEPKETIITPGIDDTATDIIDIQATIDYIDINGDEIPLPTGEATITITFADGTTTTTPTTINNGEITTTIPTQAKTGQATINISYPGTEEYKPTEAIVTVNILTQTYLSVEADDAAMDEELEIYGSLVTKDDEEGIADATINIKVTYADGQTQDLTVTTDENGDYQTTTTPLAEGNVTIVATFDETEVYSEATATDDAEITPAEPKETFISFEPSETSVENIEVEGILEYTNDEDEPVAIPNAEVTIVITLPDETVIANTTATTDEEGRFTASIPAGENTGLVTITITYPGNDEYKPTEATGNTTILEETILSVDAEEAAIDEELIIYGTLLTSNGDDISDATINIKVTYANGQTQDLTVTTDENGNYQTTTTPLAIGNVTIVATFDETTAYAGNEDNTTTIITPKELIQPEFVFSGETIESGEPMVIDAEIGYWNDDDEFVGIPNLTINVEVTFEDGTIISNQTTSTEDGKITYTVDTTGKTGNATVTLTSVATDEYESATTTDIYEITEVTTIPTTITLDANDVYYSERNATINGTLTYKDGNEQKAFAGQNITVTITYENDDGIPEEYLVTTDENGKFTVPIKPNGLGPATITAVYAGNVTEDKEYDADETSNDVEIALVEYAITFDEDQTEWDFNSTATITGKITSNLPELDVNEMNVTVENEEPFKVTLNEDGTFSFEVPEEYAGDYDVTAQVNDAIETITLHFDQAESGITAEADKDHTFVNDQVTISGTLTNIDSNVPINGANITITINGTPINAVIVTDDDGKFSYTYKPVSTGNLSIVVSFEGDSNYPGCSIDEPIMVEVTEGIETELTVDPITDAKVGEPTTISGKLTDTEGNPIAGETVTITINGKDQNVTTDDEGKYSLEYTPETNETNVTVSYPGNNEYLPANNVTTTINADKRSLQIIIINTNNDVKVNDNVTIAVLLVDGDKIVKVETLKFNQTPQAANNITTFTVSNNVNGTVTINVSFDGDDRYNATSNTTNITFNNLNTQIVANDNSVQTASINDTVTLSVDVIDENGDAVTEGTVVFTSEGKPLGTATISNGKATITTKFDKAGSHDVTVTYTAENNYNEASNDYTVKAIINKLNVTVNVTTPTSSKVGQPQNITVTAPGYANKPVQVTIGNETKTVNTDATGKAVIPYTPTEAGKVPVTVTIPESNDYSQQTVTSNFTVAKGTVTITVSPDTQSVAYPNNATYTITLKDSNGKTIAGEYIKVDGVIVNMTNAQGQVVAKVSKDAGNYSIKVEYPGSENYNSQSRNVVLNVTKAKVTVTVTNITGKVDEKLEVTAKLNQNITGGVVTFTDKDGNKLATATVVNGNAYAYVSFDKTYNGKINAAFSNNPNYENATGSGNAKINALSTVVTVDPLHNVTPGTATSITGKVTDENGKPVAEVPVNVTVGGSTKTATTDKDGNFNVPYTPTTAGDTTVQVSVPATNSTTAQTVTQSMSVNKKTSKLTVNNVASVNIGQNITVTGTLNDGNGKGIANANVIINIDGKSATVKTNSTGKFIHSVKTTQAGKSIVTVSYAGDKNYEASAAVVKTATVNKNITTTTVEKITGKALNSVNIKVTVKNGNINVPNGMVVVTDNKGKTLGVVNVSKGQATIKAVYDVPFTGNVTANYLESANYSASNGTNTIAISKLNTKVTLDPIKGKVNDVINVTAKVVDENGKAVNNGTVTFRLNGITQSLNGKAITAYVNNGVAVAQLPTNSTWMASGNNTKYLTAKYSGDAVYNESESARVNTNLTKRTAQVSITSDRIVAHGGDNISITAVVTDEGKLVNGGTVIFKIAGETIRDAKGNTIKVNVVNGQATLNHSIAIGASAKPDMPIVAVYSNGNLYDRAENSSKLTVLKADVYFNTTIAYGKNGKAVINVTLRDAFGNLCVLDTYVALKVDGSTFTHVNADDGKIYTTIDVSKVKKGVHTIEYVAGANNRYNDARYTNALVVE